SWCLCGLALNDFDFRHGCPSLAALVVDDEGCRGGFSRPNMPTLSGRGHGTHLTRHPGFAWGLGKNFSRKGAKTQRGLIAQVFDVFR
ncbi:MAG: hypothetical protein WD045_11205, partial [Pirellulaceae bacterium]